jgi:putative ABC transport system permease protein
MIRNYFKIAFRSLTNQKVLAFINVFGLSIGIACFTLFLLYAVNEFNFDRFHKNSNNIYRVYEWNMVVNGSQTNLPMPLGPALKQDLPMIENYVRFYNPWQESLLQVGKDIHRVKVSYADPGFFSVFSFSLKYGNPTTALLGVNSIVLTKSKAKELFGTDNVIGQTVQLKVDNQFHPFIISAVAETIPANSSLRFDAIGNFHFAETTQDGKAAMNNWDLRAYQTFIQLKPQSNLPNSLKSLIDFRQKYYPGEESQMKKNGLTRKDKTQPIAYGLQPLRSMHTDTKVTDENSVNTKTIWILLVIAGGILLIACINFTTLAIGRSASRSKEVGVSKVLGARRKQLILQFLSESLLLSVLSTIIGLLLVKLLMPYFARLSGRDLQFSFALYPEMIWLLFGLVFLVGLLAGGYPALVLSGFKPLAILKNKIRLGGSNFFTKSLVTLQFALSIVLIISTIVIFQQLKFMRNKYPGFNKENVVLIDASGTDIKKIFPLFKQELLKYPQVAAVTSASVGLGDGEDFGMNVFKYNDKGAMAFFNSIDADYMNVLDMRLLTGRNFDAIRPEDTTNSVIVNEALMNELGWTSQNVIGQQLKGFSADRTPVVIGVVKNFNFRPLTENVMPQLFSPFFDKDHQKFFVRIKRGNPAPALSLIQKTWKNLVSDVPLKYSFLDEKIDNYYRAEQRWSSIIQWAGCISIFLACLGLFGLAALTAINRVKEIGIRKVLGASMSSIVTLLSKDFLKLIVIALAIASPVASYFMNKWLQSFAYRIDIGWTVFAIAGLFVIVITLITISFQTIRAATANPVKSLRTE